MPRTLIVTAFITQDGVMQAPGGEPGFAHTGWVAPHVTDELGGYKLEEQLAAEVLLVGRRTFESFADAWPQREGPMAEKLNTMRKVVASTSLTDPAWGPAEVVGDDLLDAVRTLRAEDGGPVLVAGSRSLVHQLLPAGLVDEVHLQVMPVALGSGDRFWPVAAQPLGLEVRGCRATDAGVLLQELAVAT